LPVAPARFAPVGYRLVAFIVVINPWKVEDLARDLVVLEEEALAGVAGGNDLAVGRRCDIA
jgi:hypothetical protein